MLEFIRVQRFKSLLDASFPLGKINLFSGLNGMGKSSLIQTLLLLRQSMERNTLMEKGLLLKGEYVSLGIGKDILSENAEEETINFILTWKDRAPLNFRFNYSAQSDLQPIQKSLDITLHDLSLFTKNFQYLSADRVSPKPAYEISDYYIKDLNSLGNHGEYTAHFIAEYGLSPLNIQELRHKDAKSEMLLENVEKWMAEISPGIHVHAVMQNATNSVSLGYSFDYGTQRTIDFKPQNVGFGLTFVLPVITSILRAKIDDLIILENPEAHLHPGGQAVLGRLCAIAAHNGVQLFIETHSDHFLNGLRVAVKENMINPKDIKLYYLERTPGNIHESIVVSPKISENGRISYWPKGFFDEADKQLEKLL